MYRILSLDGFGSWSLIQVRALQELYGADTRGRAILGNFDLVASHASGSFVAAALAADWPLSKVAAHFLDEAARKTVIVPAHCPPRGETVSGGPRTATTRRFEALAALLNPVANTPLDELSDLVRNRRGGPVHFLFVGFDSARQQAAMMRSDPHSAAAALLPPGRPKLAEAVYAASNVPAELAGGFRRNSGALCGITNPLMAAIVETLANGRARDEIEALSLGTGNTRPSEGPAAESTDGRRLGLNLPLVSAGLPGPGPRVEDAPDASAFMAHVALGQPLPSTNVPAPVSGGSIVRINPMIEPMANSYGSSYLPNLANPTRVPGRTSEGIFARLMQLGSHAAEQEDLQLIDALADAWVSDRVSNQAIRSDSVGKCEIGHRWFSAGRDAWQSRERSPASTRRTVLPDRQRVASRAGRTTLT